MPSAGSANENCGADGTRRVAVKTNCLGGAEFGAVLVPYLNRVAVTFE